jgi:hypothetical protein
MKKILATVAVTLFLITTSSIFAQSGSGGGESGTSSGTSGGSTTQGAADSNSEDKAGHSGSVGVEENQDMSQTELQKAYGPGDEKSKSIIDNRNSTGSPEQQPSTDMQGTGKSGAGGSGSTGR